MDSAPLPYPRGGGGFLALVNPYQSSSEEEKPKLSLLTRDQIIAADDLKHEDVDVPEWGGTVRVRELTATERDQVESGTVNLSVGADGKPQADVNQSIMESFRARLAAYSIIDETGVRLFTDSDMVALGKKSSAAMQRVFNVAMRLSAFTQGDVEELVGKSEAVQSGDSPSDSASPSA